MMTTTPRPLPRYSPLASLAVAALVASFAATGCVDDGDVETTDVDPTGSDEEPEQPIDELPPQSERIMGVGVDGGDYSLTYEGVGEEEVEEWGPAAYVMDDRGHNWLADAPGHKVLVVDDDGAVVDRYLLDGLVRGLQDIEVTDTHLYVLTVGGDAPVLARVGRNDVAPSAWETFEFPEVGVDARDVTGLRRDDAGVISLELRFGLSALPVFGADGSYIAAGSPTAEYTVGEHKVELIGYDGDPEGDPSLGAVIVDGVEVTTIRASGMLGALSVIGSTPGGDIWIRASDVNLVDGAIQTRDLAYRFTLEGSLVQLLEMPMRDEIVWVEHRLAMDPDGNLRALSARPDEASVIRPMDISVASAHLPPRQGGSATAEPAAIASPRDDARPRIQCISRQEIMHRAYEYVNYEAVYNSSHMQQCSGRTPLPYFEARLGQSIRGVAYKYAGHIEVSTYHNAVQHNYTVGDLNTKYDKVVDGCSYGVDCSGFVSKAWQSGHKTTSSLHHVSHTLNSLYELKPGDAVNKPGSHVRLIAASHWNNSFDIVESTVGKEWMRVIARPMSWGDAGAGTGYKPVRYNNVCPDAPPPPPPTTTHAIFDASGYLPANSKYEPVPPVRLLDTRVAGQEHVGPLAHEETIAVTVTGKGGIPDAASVGALVLNVTAAHPIARGHLAVYPGDEHPGTSNVNFQAEQSTGNLVIVEPNAAGAVNLHHVSPEGETNIVVDAFGYFPPSADVHPITPARVLDTRDPEHGEAPLAAGTHDLQLAGIGGIPLEAQAVIANVVAILPEADGYATVYEAGTPKPKTSNLNYAEGGVRANLVIVPVSEDGLASLFTLQGAHYVVDVQGWIGDSDDFRPIPPIRVKDTRLDNGEPLDDEESIAVDIVGLPTIPDDALAVFGNLTVTQPTGPGYLQAYPDAVPMTSNLNYRAGMTAANAVVTTLGESGAINVRAIVNAP